MAQTVQQRARARPRSPIVFGVAYMGLSMLIEVALIVVVGLRVPADNAIIAPIILGASPAAAAWVCGYRGLKVLAVLAILTVMLTVFGVFVFSRVTGISTGLVEPVIVRTTAGLLAASLVRWIR